MKANPDKLKFVEINKPIIVGICELVIGLILITTASLAPPLNIPAPLWLLSLLSDLGIGLLAAGIITGTLEPVSRKRLQLDIAEIKQAHFESVLKGLMPEPIFHEVQAHIIRKPFLRTNFSVNLELSWVDETREYLYKSQTVSYNVENVSRTLERYELRVYEERINEDRFPGATSIREIRVQSSDDLEPNVYIADSLDKFIEKTDQLVEARIPVMLEPGQRVRIVTQVKSVHFSRDVYPYNLTNPTILLDFTLAHPNDLLVQALPLHPSKHAFITEVRAPTLKRWRIEAGFLPFQGIQISWRPMPLAVTENDQKDF